MNSFKTSKFNKGDKIRVKSLPCGTEEDVAIGDIATVIEVDEDDGEITYKLLSTSWSDWWFSEGALEPLNKFLNLKIPVENN